MHYQGISNHTPEPFPCLLWQLTGILLQQNKSWLEFIFVWCTETPCPNRFNFKVSRHFCSQKCCSTMCDDWLLCLALVEIKWNELSECIASGGWVPRIPRGFHMAQPAPRLNNAPMAGTTTQPSHEPQCQETGCTHHWNISGKKRTRGGGGGGKLWITKYWGTNWG